METMSYLTKFFGQVGHILGTIGAFFGKCFYEFGTSGPKFICWNPAGNFKPLEKGVIFKGQRQRVQNMG